MDIDTKNPYSQNSQIQESGVLSLTPPPTSTPKTPALKTTLIERFGLRKEHDSKIYIRIRREARQICHNLDYTKCWSSNDETIRKLELAKLEEKFEKYGADRPLCEDLLMDLCRTKANVAQRGARTKFKEENPGAKLKRGRKPRSQTVDSFDMNTGLDKLMAAKLPKAKAYTTVPNIVTPAIKSALTHTRALPSKTTDHHLKTRTKSTIIDTASSLRETPSKRNSPTEDNQTEDVPCPKRPRTSPTTTLAKDDPEEDLEPLDDDSDSLETQTPIETQDKNDGLDTLSCLEVIETQQLTYSPPPDRLTLRKLPSDAYFANISGKRIQFSYAASFDVWFQKVKIFCKSTNGLYWYKVSYDKEGQRHDIPNSVITDDEEYVTFKSRIFDILLNQWDYDLDISGGDDAEVFLNTESLMLPL